MANLLPVAVLTTNFAAMFNPRSRLDPQAHATRLHPEVFPKCAAAVFVARSLEAMYHVYPSSPGIGLKVPHYLWDSVGKVGRRDHGTA